MAGPTIHRSQHVNSGVRLSRAGFFGLRRRGGLAQVGPVQGHRGFQGEAELVRQGLRRREDVPQLRFELVGFPLPVLAAATEVVLPGHEPALLVLALLERLNLDPRVHGILVQAPLPRHIDASKVFSAVLPGKDVDGFHPVNIGGLFTGRPGHRACTPLGVIELLDRTGIPIEGKEAVIVGRSNIVGKPLALMLLNRHATVTVCHTRTRDLAGVARRAALARANCVSSSCRLAWKCRWWNG